MMFANVPTYRNGSRDDTGPDSPGDRDAFFAVYQVGNHTVGTIIYQNSFFSSTRARS